MCKIQKGGLVFNMFTVFYIIMETKGPLRNLFSFVDIRKTLVLSDFISQLSKYVHFIPVVKTVTMSVHTK